MLAGFTMKRVLLLECVSKWLYEGHNIDLLGMRHGFVLSDMSQSSQES